MLTPSGSVGETHWGDSTANNPSTTAQSVNAQLKRKSLEDYYRKHKKHLDFQVAGGLGETWQGLLILKFQFFILCLQVRKNFDEADLIIEIFKRLAVKSILRLRCACKTWCALTRSANFINIHLKYQTAISNDRLFVKHWNEEANTTVFSLFPTELQDGLPLNLNLEFLNKDISRPYFEIAYCNGILCVHNHTCLIALWNPATREFKRLPFLPHIMSIDETVTICDLGFGFDYKKSNDYKIVALLWNWNEEKENYLSRAHVYSLRRNSWREVDVVIPKIIGTYPYSIYTNGFLHWTTLAYYPSVVSFDLAEESFKVTPMPDFPPPERNYLPLKLASVNGLLAAIYSSVLFSESSTYFEVWVMKECGVKESWTRKYIAKLPGKFLIATGLWTKSELLVKREGSLYIYDPNSKQISDLRVHGDCNSLDAFIYKESLVPIIDFASPIF
ncbi:hypothetical protein LguiA_018449 [Lonicera macranthoides]